MIVVKENQEKPALQQKAVNDGALWLVGWAVAMAFRSIAFILMEGSCPSDAAGLVLEAEVGSLPTPSP